MAELPLNQEEYRKVVELLVKHGRLVTTIQRQNFLSEAGLDDLAGLMDFSGSTQTFVQHLIRELQDQGLLPETGQHALVAMLNVLRERLIGWPNDLGFVDQLLRRISNLPMSNPEPDIRSRQSPKSGTLDLSSFARTPNPPLPGSDSGQVHLLVLAANPIATNHLRLDEEVRTIKERLREGKTRNAFNLESEWAVREEDLARIVLDYKPHLIHFCGHGEEGGAIVLEDNFGNPRVVEPERLASLFSILQRQINVQGIVLNACWSEAQADALVERGRIPWVVGMRRPIEDSAAIAFASGFYRGLAFELPVQGAFDLGVHALVGDYLEEEDNPNALSASGVDLNKTSVTVGTGSGGSKETVAIDPIVLRDLLLECPSMADPDSRKDLRGQLPAYIVRAYRKGATDNTDVLNLVKTCLNYSGGIQALLKAIREMEEDSIPLVAVEAYLHRVSGG